MSFQVPPTLPDYSKLTFLLNNSGVQKWNPAVYDILKQLIDAVRQSQNVITTNAESEVTNINNEITTINNTIAGLSSPIQMVVIALSVGQIRTLNSIPVKIISGISNRIIVPIAVCWDAIQPAAYNLARSASLVYNSGGAASITSSWPTSLNSIGDFSSNAGIATGPSALKSPDNALASDVYIKGNGDNTGGTIFNNAFCTVWYGTSNR